MGKKASAGLRGGEGVRTLRYFDTLKRWALRGDEGRVASTETGEGRAVCAGSAGDRRLRSSRIYLKTSATCTQTGIDRVVRRASEKARSVAAEFGCRAFPARRRFSGPDRVNWWSTDAARRALAVSMAAMRPANTSKREAVGAALAVGRKLTRGPKAAPPRAARPTRCWARDADRAPPDDRV
jgi:hypothetical protein